MIQFFGISVVLTSFCTLFCKQDEREPPKWQNVSLWGSMARFLYALYVYDPEDPWCSLLRSCLLVCVSTHSTFYLTHSLTCTLPGLQTCFYVPEFCREGTKGHAIRKCPPPWHEFCYHRFRGVYRNSGSLNITFLSQNGIDV
jgi:hypothetical protein